MRKRSFIIPLFKIDVTFIQLSPDDPSEEISRALNRLGLDSEHINEVVDKNKNGYIDGGYTYTNAENCKIIALFFPMTSHINMVNIQNHEKRHIEDRTLEIVNVNDGETAAYLAGWLSEQLYKFNQE